PEFKVGEPITRTLSINAKGLLATLLPKLDVTDVDGVNIYPEQPETETRTDGTWVYGISKQNMSYMPTKAGALVIPELQLVWWDTVAGVERSAVLPKWTVDVAPGVNVPTQRALKPEPKELVEEQVETPAIDENLSSEGTRKESWFKQAQENWRWLLAVLLVILIAVFWSQRDRGKRDSAEIKILGEKEITRINSKTLRELQQKFRLASNDNDASLSAELLLQIAAISTPEKPPKTLPALAALLESGSDEINKLDRFLYAGDDAQWAGSGCYEVFKGGLQFKSPAKKATEALAPLYPG
ncbi:MAG: BatD family protein, partial [Gammaproteobacteria bacterium]|nr:BatD family protein [Gammaproteobacteria bacterium]